MSMSRPFVNCSNHPHAGWPEAQRAAARALAEDLLDVPSERLRVDPFASTEDIRAQARGLAAELLAHAPTAVFVAGEPRLSFALVALLQAAGVEVVSATTERRAVERLLPDGTVEKVQRFEFCAWMPFPALHVLD